MWRNWQKSSTKNFEKLKLSAEHLKNSNTYTLICLLWIASNCKAQQKIRVAYLHQLKNKVLLRYVNTQSCSNFFVLFHNKCFSTRNKFKKLHQLWSCQKRSSYLWFPFYSLTLDNSAGGKLQTKFIDQVFEFIKSRSTWSL